ncbi:MAG: hypothetical protein AAF243_04580, partial [Cyanobacteria bacterium P01_A01_bin.137]
MFEAALARKIKRDSWFQIKELGDGLGITVLTPKPPNEPLAFFKGRRYGKQVYTNGADQDTIVAPLYKQATEDILGGVKELNYSSQNWNDVHAGRLGLVLPLCFSLRTLNVMNVGLTARGLRAILDDSALPKLEVLDVSHNTELGDDGACVVAAALKKRGKVENLREFDVRECNLTATGLRAILERNQELGDEGACALGAALKKQSALANLHELNVRFCNLTATGLRAILEPVVDDDALPKLKKLFLLGSSGDDDE